MANENKSRLVEEVCGRFEIQRVLFLCKEFFDFFLNRTIEAGIVTGGEEELLHWRRWVGLGS